MTTNCKPLWSEGMLIRPQHFQQYDRWIEHYLTERTSYMVPFGYGIGAIDISSDLLPLGKIGISRLRAIMPDGSVIDIPRQLPAPQSRAVKPEFRSSLVKLAIKVRPQDGAEISNEGSIRRYNSVEQPVRDTSAPEKQPTALKVGQLSVRLLFEGEPEEECVTLPIARIREVEASGAVQLDQDYAPPCLDLHTSPRLINIVNEVRSLLKSRADALARGLELERGGGESVGASDLMALILINGREALFNHFATALGIHPEQLYRTIVQTAAELSTFSKSRRRNIDFPPYNHLDVVSSLRSVIDFMRDQLSVVIERNTVSLTLQDRGYGIRTATVADRTLFQDSQFILVAYADMPAEVLRSRFPSTVKIGSVEKIRQLVNLQLPGVSIQALPVAPRALPFVQNAVYFELDQNSEIWRELVRSAAFALHISGEFPGMHIELWAVRG